MLFETIRVLLALPMKRSDPDIMFFQELKRIYDTMKRVCYHLMTRMREYCRALIENKSSRRISIALNVIFKMGETKYLEA